MNSRATKVPIDHDHQPDRRVARRGGVAAAFSAVTALALAHGGTAAQLTSKAHLSHGDAMAVLSLLTGSSGALIYVFYPQLIAVLGTLRLLLAIAGSGAVIGF
ncbi:MAG: hypothetical protein ACRC0L_02550 [Angustibacter sp.]